MSFVISIRSLRSNQALAENPSVKNVDLIDGDFHTTSRTFNEKSCPQADQLNEIISCVVHAHTKNYLAF